MGAPISIQPMTLEAGTRLRPFEVVSLVGAGGMGEVYRARDTRRARTVAIKVLSSRLTADAWDELPLQDRELPQRSRSTSHSHLPRPIL